MTPEKTNSSNASEPEDNSPLGVQREVWRLYHWNLIILMVVSLVVGGLIGVFGVGERAFDYTTRLTPPPDWQTGDLPIVHTREGVKSGATVSVYVSGAVQTPQVVTLTAGSLVVDALEAVGGALPDANLDAINLAAPLANHQQIVVPHQVTPVPQATKRNAETSGDEGEENTEKIELNTATVLELEQLPRIGPALAERIVTYRQENGPFEQPEDIQAVSGIGEATFAQLEPYITVEP